MNYFFPRFKDGKYKAVTLSYDDGSRPDLKLAEIFDKHGMKCTFNLCASLLGKNENDWHVTREEVKTHILGKGHEIAAHGDLHKAPSLCTPAQYIKDVLDCRTELERSFDMIIRGYAYPDVGIRLLEGVEKYEAVKSNLKALSIAYARTLGSDNDKFQLPEDWYKWMPTAHHNNPDVIEYCKKFVELKEPSYCASKAPKLFYLWGHSHEFERDNNWDVIENICDILGGRDDIWYATNIEICDYINAYNSLIFSADSSKVYNPTDKKVWFLYCDKPMSVESGETLAL